MENYESYYDIRYPAAERSAGRPLRTSSAYPWHAAHGAVFGEKAGWERVNHYSVPGDESLRPRGWAGHHWSPCVETEHVAVRERAGLFDESSFAMIEIIGPGRRVVLRARLRRTRATGHPAPSSTPRRSTTAAASRWT